MNDDLFPGSIAAAEERLRSNHYPRGVPVDVCLLFEKLTLRLWRDKWRHYSARAILHQIRWHFRVEQGNRQFKANNNWTPDLARWMMAKYAFLEGFFRKRQTKRERWADAGLIDEDDEDWDDDED